MKRSLLPGIFLPVVLVVTTLMACKKGGNGGDDNPPVTASVSGKYTIASGTAVNFSNAEVGASLVSNKMLNIIIKADNTTTITLSIRNYTAAGIYTFNTDNFGNFASTQGIFSSGAAGSSGAIEIKTLTNDKVTGTFSFTAFNGSNVRVVVESGQFESKLVRG